MRPRRHRHTRICRSRRSRIATTVRPDHRWSLQRVHTSDTLAQPSCGQPAGPEDAPHELDERDEERDDDAQYRQKHREVAQVHRFSARQIGLRRVGAWSSRVWQRRPSGRVRGCGPRAILLRRLGGECSCRRVIGSGSAVVDSVRDGARATAFACRNACAGGTRGPLDRRTPFLQHSLGWLG